eukprot:2787347-Prymnesium_polylepis.1
MGCAMVLSAGPVNTRPISTQLTIENLMNSKAQKDETAVGKDGAPLGRRPGDRCPGGRRPWNARRLNGHNGHNWRLTDTQHTHAPVVSSRDSMSRLPPLHWVPTNRDISLSAPDTFAHGWLGQAVP